MPVGVVKALEMIDIHHRDAELAGETGQGFIQRAPAGQLSQSVAVGHHVRRFDHRDDENQARRRQPDLLARSRRPPGQRHEHRHEPVEVAAYRRLGLAHPRHREQRAEREEGQD